MKKTWIQMGMPITIEIVDKNPTKAFKLVKDYFQQIDERFSTYKPDSEISQINDKRLKIKESSAQMKQVFQLSEQTKQETDGFFDIQRDGKIDPSGLVKGWAIKNAADLLQQHGFKNFYIDAGGDIQTSGQNKDGDEWSVGIRNPFNPKQLVKILSLTNKGVATSGTYNRGQHIYNPHQDAVPLDHPHPNPCLPAGRSPLKGEEIKGNSFSEIVSITVIGPNIYEADRFATAAFAMGKEGIYFIESLQGFEGYQIDDQGTATLTSHFEEYVI